MISLCKFDHHVVCLLLWWLSFSWGFETINFLEIQLTLVWGWGPLMQSLLIGLSLWFKKKDILYAFLNLFVRCVLILSNITDETIPNYKQRGKWHIHIHRKPVFSFLFLVQYFIGHSSPAYWFEFESSDHSINHLTILFWSF